MQKYSWDLEIKRDFKILKWKYERATFRILNLSYEKGLAQIWWSISSATHWIWNTLWLRQHCRLMSVVISGPKWDMQLKSLHQSLWGAFSGTISIHSNEQIHFSNDVPDAFQFLTRYDDPNCLFLPKSDRFSKNQSADDLNKCPTICC